MSRKDKRAGARAGEHGRGRRGTEAPSKAKTRWPLPRLILLAGGLLLAAGLGAQLWRQSQNLGPAAPPPSAVGGPFAMIDQNGRSVDQHVLEGRWNAVFFGYTYCPDVCPATLSALKIAMNRLNLTEKDLQVVFVSVDPERDTPAQLKSYLSTDAFPARTLGLTGSKAQVDQIAKAYKVYYAKNGSGSSYLVDHSSAIYLVDPKGRFHSLISDAQGLDTMTSDLARALGRG